MFRRLRLKFKQGMHPFVMLAAGLIGVLLITSVAGIWHHHQELKQQVRAANTEVSAAPVEAISVQSYNNSSERLNTVSSATAATNQYQAQATTQAPTENSLQAAAPAQSAAPAPAVLPAPQSTTPATVTVSLYINDTYKGDVVLPAGSNQCDVLQKARQSGVISSLDMRYSNQYKTYAVYVIEGQGDSASIWWTYSVNGKSPPYGCSTTKVAAGDTTNWKYVKQ